MKRKAIRMLGWLTVIMLLITQTMGTALARSFSGTSTINASNLEDGEEVTLKGYESTHLTINIDADKTIESIQPETTDAGHITFEGDDIHTLTISDGIKSDRVAGYGTNIDMNSGNLVVNNRLYAGKINVTGGSITATGSDEAIYTNNDLTVSGGSVSATATGSDSVGIRVWRADLDGGSVSASGGEAAIKPRGNESANSIIDLGENMGVISPAGGRVSDDQKSIITAGGAVATAVKLGAVTKYPVWVSGTQVTSANKDDILGDGGKAKYDPGTRTLTLNNPTITGVHSGYAIDVTSGDLTVLGSAMLQAGIFGRSDLYINASLSINATNTAGISSYNDTTIAGGSLQITSQNGRGIQCYNGSLEIDGGTVIVTSLQREGIYADVVKINGGTVNSSGKTDGIHAASISPGVVISGGTVTATGSEEGTGDGAGIFSGGKVEIANATVTAKGRVHGIAADGDITIAGNRVTAETWVQNESQALRTDGNLTISGGTVTTKTAATGIHSSGNIRIENGTEKVETDAKKHAISAGTALVIGDGLMIKEPAGGIIQEGYIYEAGGTTEATHALIVPKEVAVPSWTVTFDANGHGTAPAAQTVTDGGTAVKPADPTETGWTFGGWYTDAACTAAFDFSTPVTDNVKLFAKWTEGSSAPVTPATYSVVSITNSAWTRGSGSSVVITVKRSEADDTCFSHFTGVQIDSAALASGDYEAKAGSTVVTLKAATLQKLSAGNHTVAIHFDDGKAEANLTVSDAANTVVPEVPKTGDSSPIGLWIALTVLSAAGLWALTGFGRKRRSAGRR